MLCKSLKSRNSIVDQRKPKKYYLANAKTKTDESLFNSYTMNTYAIAAQLIIAASITYVWVFRFNNIIVEFKQYELSDLTRSAVGATKIILATLIVAGIWYPALVFIPSLIMGFLMLSAQYFHFKVKNPLLKYLPSFFLLLLCLFLAFVSERPF